MREVEELIITTELNHNYAAMLNNHDEQRVIIKVMSEEDLLQKDLLKVFISLKKEYGLNNFAILLPRECEKEEYINTFVENSIDFFFLHMANNWVTLHYLIGLKVSDIYITEALGFEIDKASKICHDNNVTVRIFPNVAQKELPPYDILSFFIRPEDIDFYDQYVDVCEFFYKDITQQPVYYKIYAKDKQWFGELQEIIIGLEQSIDSRHIVKQFAEVRSHCGMRCLKGTPCQLCYHALDLAQTLKKAGLIIDNSKEEITDDKYI